MSDRHQRAAIDDARRVAAGLAPTSGLFEASRQQLLEQYRCTACNGRRLQGVGGIMIGPYYRVCRGCDGRGYRVVSDEEE